MELNLKNKFELNIDGGIDKLIGTFRSLTKTEEKELQEVFKEHTAKEKKVFKNNKKLNKIQGKFEIMRSRTSLEKIDDDTKEKLLDKMDTMLDEISTISDDNETIKEELTEYDLGNKVATYRINKCVSTEQKELLKTCVDAVGGAMVLEYIVKAVEEGKPKPTKN